MSNRRIIGIIPARYESTRFPGKPLAVICGRPMIEIVFNNCRESEVFDEIYVATDNERICCSVENFGGRAVMTDSNIETGTDRVFECCRRMNVSDDDIVINIQGDEPLVSGKVFGSLVSLFDDKTVKMATLKTRIKRHKEISDNNVVKVITDKNGDAIYFSRFGIPFLRNIKEFEYFKHIGIYGYRYSFLKEFRGLPKSELEIAESLEQLRVIENGYKIRVGLVDVVCLGVDSPDDIKKVEAIMRGACSDEK